MHNFFIDVNECIIFEDVCKNGRCVNTDGSFRCVCLPGYTLDNTGTQCVGQYGNMFSKMLNENVSKSDLTTFEHFK